MDHALPDVPECDHRLVLHAGRIRSLYVETWDRLAEICAQYLGKGQLVAVEGRIQTRQWEDDKKTRHWKTEIVANSVEMLSGRRKKDYAAESGAEALEAQAEAFGAAADDEAAEPEDQESVAVA